MVSIQPTPNSNTTPEVSELEDAAAIKANRMATLLGIEVGAREATTIADLAIKAVNDPRSLTGFQQAFFLENYSAGKFRTVASTSQATINRQAPLIQMIEDCVKQISLKENFDEIFEFELQEIQTSWAKEQAVYPYKYFYWIPVLIPAGANKEEISNNKPSQYLGGLLFARTTPWREVDIIVLRRIIDTYAHAWHALKLSNKLKPTKITRPKLLTAGVFTLLIVAMFLPIPYTSVAPAQIIADDPWVISAPIDGVINEVYVNPNQEIKEGDRLFSFVDTTLRNSATIAENELYLANARLENTRRSALIESEGRREITIANAERKIAATRESYARELLENVRINAIRNGIILFTNKNDLKGKPVSTGQKIMEIADPTRIAIAIEVPPGDGLAMKIGQPVNVYLDVNPLKPVKGTLKRASYTPASTESGTLAYHGIVEIDSDTETIPRIGLRGTAKLNAGKTSLGFWLFRKPIVLLRRSFGI